MQLDDWFFPLVVIRLWDVAGASQFLSGHLCGPITTGQTLVDGGWENIRDLLCGRSTYWRELLGRWGVAGVQVFWILPLLSFGVFLRAVALLVSSTLLPLGMLLMHGDHRAVEPPSSLGPFVQLRPPAHGLLLLDSLGLVQEQLPVLAALSLVLEPPFLV
ncbi:hypothetical protein Ancab_014502 [Ancistrocladus abbreviatus]